MRSRYIDHNSYYDGKNTRNINLGLEMWGTSLIYPLTTAHSQGADGPEPSA
jgi:hypothetical protein